MTAKSTPPTAEAPKKYSVFVVSPIGATGTEVHQKASYALKYIFREALKGDKWDVHRADEGKSPDSIGQHVIKRLHDADLVIADLTGHNPNVFYELAIAHGWRKPVVHLISKGEKVPFDIVDQRTIFYDITDLASVEEAVNTLRTYAEYALEHADELVNPLTSFDMFNQIRADHTDGGDAVADVLEQVVARLSRIEARVGGKVERRPFTGGYSLDGEVVFPMVDPEDFDAEAARYAALVETVELMQGTGASEQRVKNLRREMEVQLKRFPPEVRGEVVRRALRSLEGKSA